MTDTIEYYRFVRPADPRPPANFERYAFEHRNFIVSRVPSEYMLYEIKTLEHGLPPIRLRGSFTTAERAKRHIDDFWVAEENNKAETKQ